MTLLETEETTVSNGRHFMNIMDTEEALDTVIEKESIEDKVNHLQENGGMTKETAVSEALNDLKSELGFIKTFLQAMNGDYLIETNEDSRGDRFYEIKRVTGRR